ncbi:MAG: hypothetical protein R3C05_28480 [Pirellulaceae bacterium]
MDEQDFSDLYALMRGNADAITVMDAKGLYAHQEYEEALRKLQAVKQRYEAGKLRVMRMKIDDTASKKSKEEEAKDRRLQKRQQRYHEVMQKLDEILEALGPIAERAAARKRREAEAETEAEARQPAEPKVADQKDADQADVDRIPSEETIDVQASDELTHADDDPVASRNHLFDAFANCKNAAEQRSLLAEHFVLSAIRSQEDIRPGDLHFIDGGTQTYLATIRNSDNPQRVRLKSAITGDRLRTIDLPTYLKLAKHDKAVRLDSLTSEASEASKRFPAGQSKGRDASEPSHDDAVAASSLQESAEVSKILDKGAFSQLADAANRTGLCAQVDLITHVRDREFRMGNFQDALQTMEAVHAKFTAAVTSYQAKLRQEEAAIQSGKLKMSPKDLQAKRMRDTAQGQLIQRAQNRFSRVLDGLRVLLRREVASE